jgi:hypothetical protein
VPAHALLFGMSSREKDASYEEDSPQRRFNQGISLKKAVTPALFFNATATAFGFYKNIRRLARAR